MTPADRINTFLGRAQSHQYIRANSSDAISAMLHDLANAYDTNQHPTTRARYLEYLAGEAWHQAELSMRTVDDSQAFEHAITNKVERAAHSIASEANDGVLRETLTRDYLAAILDSIQNLVDAIDFRDYCSIEAEQRHLQGNARHLILCAAKAAWLIDQNDSGN